MEHERQKLENVFCDSQFINNNKVSTIASLNEKCLVYIIQLLPIADRVRIERVCKRFYEASKIVWQRTRKLNFSIESWGFFKWGIVDDDILQKILNRCGEFITHVKMPKYNMANCINDMTILAKCCPNLQSVQLDAFVATKPLLKALPLFCENITEISLRPTFECNDETFKLMFSLLKNLRRIRITDNPYFDGSSLKCLANAESIEEISLVRCCIKVGESFNNLDTFKNLHTLSLSETWIGPYDVEHFFNCLTAINIKKLDISNNHEVIDDNFLLRLKDTCKNLLSLNISRNRQVTNEGLTAVATLQNIEELDISYLIGFSINSIPSMSNLRYLYCRKNRINNDEAALLLSELSKIEYLDLSFCRQISKPFVESAIKSITIRENGVPLKIRVFWTKVEVDDLPKPSLELEFIL